jgi:hypothetical protein
METNSWEMRFFWINASTKTGDLLIHGSFELSKHHRAGEWLPGQGTYKNCIY